MLAGVGKARIAAAALSLLMLASVRLDLVPLLRGPAPYPPEWQWRHRPRAFARVVPALPLAVGLILLLAWSGTDAARRRPRRTTALLLTGGLVLGGAWPIALLDGEDGGAMGHLVRRTASPGYLSYHAVAGSSAARDPAAFLREYPRLLPRLPIHAATHPPGPVLMFRALIGLFEGRPALAAPLDAVVRHACGAEVRDCGENVATLKAAERAAALAGALLLHAAAVFTLLPIALLGFQLTRDALAAARVAALWPLVPGAALFVPALDPALALPVMLALAAFRLAVTAESSLRRVLAALLAGAAAAVAGFLSYGSALFLLLGGAAILASLPRAWREWPARVGRAAALAAAACAALFAAAMAVGHDPLLSARTALAIHSEGYTARRSYPLWLAFGPLDFVIFLGLPIALGVAGQAAGAARMPTWRDLTPPARLALGVAIALAVLFVGGWVRGETGRLLVPMMPLALLGGVLRLGAEPEPDGHAAAFLALLLAAFDVVLRVSWRI